MRVFAGIPMPETIKKIIGEILEYFKKDYPGLTIVKPGGLHITVLFFGELPETQVNTVIQLMDKPELKIAKIKTKLNAISQFPPKGNPRVVFVDLIGGIDQICTYQQQYAKLITAAGIKYDDADKTFIPHVTIARNKRERIQTGYTAGIQVPHQEFELDRLILYKSVLCSSGADYSPLKEVLFRQEI